MANGARDGVVFRRAGRDHAEDFEVKLEGRRHLRHPFTNTIEVRNGLKQAEQTEGWHISAECKSQSAIKGPRLSHNSTCRLRHRESVLHNVAVFQLRSSRSLDRIDRIDRLLRHSSRMYP